MVNFDTLELMAKIQTFADLLKAGKVKAFSEVKKGDDSYNNLVYDDSKEFRCPGDCIAYPIASMVMGDTIGMYEPCKENKFLGKNYSVCLCVDDGRYSVEIDEENGTDEPEYMIAIYDTGEWGFVLSK